MFSITDSLLDLVFFFRLGNKAIDNQLCYYLNTCNNKEDPRLLKRSDLPIKSDDFIRLIIVSDTHLQHEAIGNFSGDVFIHAGDIFMTNSKYSTYSSIERLKKFNIWLGSNVSCEKKIIVAGNHDCIIENLGKNKVESILTNGIYLENSSIDIYDYKIYGTPISAGKSGNKAFQSPEFKEQTIQNIQLHKDIDILITHGPSFDILSILPNQPSLYIWGHMHEYYGIHKPKSIISQNELSCLNVNASIMNGSYNPHQYPIFIDLPRKKNL